MRYEITPEVLAVAAQMADKAGTGETPEDYITKRIDKLIQGWVDECGADPVKTAEARAIAAEAKLESLKRDFEAKVVEVESLKSVVAVAVAVAAEPEV